jgi:hypothetical protein
MLKPKIFYKSSRKKEKLEFIRIKNKFKLLGFYTLDEISNTTQWADIYFLSKKCKNIYNATIHTTKCIWLDTISEHAWNDLNLITNGVPLFRFIDLESSTKSLIRTSTVYDPPLFCIDGLTASQFLEKRKLELINEKNIFINEYSEILSGYKFGIGLNLIIHAPFISIENIQQTIQKFLNNEEKEYQEKIQYSFDSIN